MDTAAPDVGASPWPPERRPFGGTLRRVAESPTRVALVVAGALVAGLTLVVATPLHLADALAAGAPSPRDFRAPRPLSYVSRVRTGEAREAAAVQVAPVYELDLAAADRQVARLRAVLHHVALLQAQPAYAESDDDKRAWLATIPELGGLTPAQVGALIGSGPAGEAAEVDWNTLADEVAAVVARAMRQRVSDSSRPAVLDRLVEMVDPALTTERARLVADLAAPFVVVNTVESAERTRALREAARQATSDVRVSFVQGETIARQGERLTAAQIEALLEAGLQPGAFSWPALAGYALVFLALVSVLAAGLARLKPGFWRRPGPLALTAVLVVGFAVGARLVVATEDPALVQAYPAAAVAMTVAAMLGIETGLLAAVLLAMAIGLIGGPHLDTALYVLLGGAAGAIALGRVERLKTFLFAAAVVALVDLVVISGFALTGPTDGALWRPELVVLALVNAALSSGLAALGVLAAGSWFGVTTSFQLLELLRPDHPLLHELQIKAPGTYQHSIVLANLAEAAASAIGADALLVRVGAYYHDIGKTARPYFFIENQLGVVNPHDGLDPRASARIIVDHVAEGVALARQHRLPASVIRFIEQHHGTGRVEYFYHQATQAAGGAMDAVDGDDFDYPGPRPQARETAIVMLADAVEATVRAQSPQSAGEIDAIVQRIVQRRLESGQLEDSELTLGDLRRIRRAFVRTLRTMYHPRIQYPADVAPGPGPQAAGAAP